MTARRMARGRLALAAASVGLVLAALPAVTSGVGASLLAPCAGTDWPMFGHDPARSFASPDTCINNVSAATLLPKWFFNTSSPVTAQPVIAGGTLFVGAFNGVFYALGADQGTQKWSFDVTRYDHDITDYGEIPDSAATATLAGTPMVVVGGGDTLFVLNAATGTLLSHLCLDRVDATCQGKSGIVSEIESSPVIVPWTNGDDLVVVGQDANEADPSGVEGMNAMVLAPGGSLTPLWQFDPETLVATNGLAPVSTTPIDHGCGDVWSSPTVDLSSGTVIFGAGNCNHPVNPAQTESTFAIDLATGSLKWQASPIPFDNQQDLDFGATPNLLGGGLVGEGGKDGVYYAYSLTSPPSSPPGPAAAWKTKVATASSIGGMIGSTAVGTITTLTGAVHQAIFADTSIPIATNNEQASIENDVMHPEQAFGVHAVDAVTHQVLWNTPVGPIFGAATYDNGVVFAPGTTADSMLVIDANTGLPLRVMPLNAPPSSPVAISGDSVYGGAGTTESSPPLSALAGLGGVWAFRTVL